MIVDIRKFKSFPQFKKRFLNDFPKNYQEDSMIDSCWYWEGTINTANSIRNYGRVGYGGDHYYAHRISYLIFKGLIPLNQVIRHTCDNPRCVNPKHLIAGTQSDNGLDMAKKHRQGQQKLNSEAVKVIKWFLKYKPKRGLITKLARLHNVSRATIYHIKSKKTMGMG